MAKQHPPAPKDTWAVYQTLFSDHLESVNAAPMTISTYRLAVEQLGIFLRASGFPLDPTVVEREHLVEWMRYLQRTKEAGGQGISAQTALQRYRSVSRLFAFLVSQGDLSESPMAKMTPPRVPEKLVPVVPDDSLKRLFKACGGPGFEARRDKAIISLFLDTGVRIAEMASIGMAELDLVEREVTVMGKGRRGRVLRFVKETRSDIQRYLLERSRHPRADEDALWVGKRGRLTKGGIYQMVQRRCQDAEIPAIHPHQFRHTFAHLYLKAGGNEGDLMRVTGWKSRQMVDRYGASVAAGRAAEAHDRYSPRKGF